MKKQALMAAAMAMAFVGTGVLGASTKIEAPSPPPYLVEPLTAGVSRKSKRSRTNQRKRRKNIRQVPQLLRAKANRK